MATTIYTGQIGKVPNIPNAVIVDSTVKTGHSIIAPTWDMVNGVKAFINDLNANKAIAFNNIMTTEEYTQRYLAILADSFANRESWFLELLKEEVIIFTCYCNLTMGRIRFCHRLLLAEAIWQHFSPLGYDITLGGELSNSNGFTLFQ